MKKAFVFDFDDTLATTKCMINVHDERLPDGDRCVKKITAQEFNSYNLKKSEYFNFDEFRSEDFIHNAKPTDLLDLAKEVYSESHHVYILTARESDVSAAITAWLYQYGIKPKTVFCVGGNKKSIAKRKRNILITIMQSYDRTYYYDDCPRNIKLAPVGKKIKKYKV